MVKSWISVIIVLLILSGGFIFETLIIPKQFKEFETNLNEVYEKIENESVTEDDVLLLQKNWINKKRFLHIFIPHNDIKEMELWISETVAFVKEENYDEAITKVMVLKDLCREIPRLFSFNIGNVF